MAQFINSHYDDVKVLVTFVLLGTFFYMMSTKK